jgi:hypothetical protein
VVPEPHSACLFVPGCMAPESATHVCSLLRLTLRCRTSLVALPPAAACRLVPSRPPASPPALTLGRRAAAPSLPDSIHPRLLQAPAEHPRLLLIALRARTALCNLLCASWPAPKRSQPSTTETPAWVGVVHSLSAPARRHRRQRGLDAAATGGHNRRSLSTGWKETSVHNTSHRLYTHKLAQIANAHQVPLFYTCSTHTCVKAQLQVAHATRVLVRRASGVLRRCV